MIWPGVDCDCPTLSLGLRTITHRETHRAVSLQEVDVDDLHSVNGARLLPPSADFALWTDGALVLPINFKIRNREAFAGFGLPTRFFHHGAEQIDLVISPAVSQ